MIIVHSKNFHNTVGVSYAQAGRGGGGNLGTGFWGGKECFRLIEGCCLRTGFSVLRGDGGGGYAGIGGSGNSSSGEDGNAGDDGTYSWSEDLDIMRIGVSIFEGGEGGAWAVIGQLNNRPWKCRILWFLTWNNRHTVGRIILEARDETRSACLQWLKVLRASEYYSGSDGSNRTYDLSL